jgi:hypothetical protein
MHRNVGLSLENASCIALITVATLPEAFETENPSCGL